MLTPKIYINTTSILNKSSAVAACMRWATVATIDMGRKQGAVVPLSLESWVPV